jgi:hypothetical protein
MKKPYNHHGQSSVYIGVTNKKTEQTLCDLTWMLGVTTVDDDLYLDRSAKERERGIGRRQDRKEEAVARADLWKGMAQYCTAVVNDKHPVQCNPRHAA